MGAQELAMLDVRIGVSRLAGRLEKVGGGCRFATDEKLTLLVIERK